MNTNQLVLKKSLKDTNLINYFIVCFAIFFFITALNEIYFFVGSVGNIFGTINYFSSLTQSFINLIIFILIKVTLNKEKEHSSLHLYTLLAILLSFKVYNVFSDFYLFYQHISITNIQDNYLLFQDISKFLANLIIIIFLFILIKSYKKYYDTYSFKVSAMFFSIISILISIYYLIKNIGNLKDVFNATHSFSFYEICSHIRSIIMLLSIIIVSILWLVFIHKFDFYNTIHGERENIDLQDKSHIHHNSLIIKSLKKYHIIWIGVSCIVFQFILYAYLIIYLMKNSRPYYVISYDYIQILSLLFIELLIFLSIGVIVIQNRTSASLFTLFSIFIVFNIQALIQSLLYIFNLIYLFIDYNLLDKLFTFQYIEAYIDILMTIILSLALLLFIFIILIQFYKRIKVGALQIFKITIIIILLIYNLGKSYKIYTLLKDVDFVKALNNQTYLVSILSIIFMVLSSFFWISFIINYVNQYKLDQEKK